MQTYDLQFFNEPFLSRMNRQVYVPTSRWKDIRLTVTFP